MTSPGNATGADRRPPPPWWSYRGDGVPATNDARIQLPDPPPWRTFRGNVSQQAPPDDDEEVERRLGRADTRPVRQADPHECDMVNAAIRLRRPLLVTGNPGVGKASIAFRLSRELRLGRVLQWPITSRTTLRSGLYEYDAIGRAQATNRAVPGTAASDERPSIGDFIRLGPVGTALLGSARPRVLLVAELDKSDIDLPDELMRVLENGEYTVPELARLSRWEPEVSVHTDDPDRVAMVRHGRIHCHEFPIVVITSNGEREFSPDFLCGCILLDLKPPNVDDLAAMVRAHLPDAADQLRELIEDFLNRPASDALARDQLLNAVHLTSAGIYADDKEAWQGLMTKIWRPPSVGR